MNIVAYSRTTIDQLYFQQFIVVSNNKQGCPNGFELGQDLPQHTQTWLGPDFESFYNYPKNHSFDQL